MEVELDRNTPTALLIPFAIFTAILVFVHLFSLVIASRLLPEFEAAVVQPSFNAGRLLKLASGWPVQLCWILSNIVGILLFLLELILIAYVKFYDDSDEDRIHVGTGTLVIVLILTLSCAPIVVYFYRVVSKQEIRFHEQRLERARELLDSINQSTAATDKLDAESYHSRGSYERVSSRRTHTEV